MAGTATDLVVNILPRVPVRHWVRSFPIPLRSLFSVHPELLTPVLRIIHRAIPSFLMRQTKVKRNKVTTGAITLISVLAAQPISTRICRAGARRRLSNRCRRRRTGVHRSCHPTQVQPQSLLIKIIKRIMTLLASLGQLIEEDGIVYLARTEHTDLDNAMVPLQAASGTSRMTMGPRASCKVFHLVRQARRGTRNVRATCASMRKV